MQTLRSFGTAVLITSLIGCRESPLPTDPGHVPMQADTAASALSKPRAVSVIQKRPRAVRDTPACERPLRLVRCSCGTGNNTLLYVRSSLLTQGFRLEHVAAQLAAKYGFTVYSVDWSITAVMASLSDEQIRAIRCDPALVGMVKGRYGSPSGGVLCQPCSF
jgi:hypothetical protein